MSEDDIDMLGPDGQPSSRVDRDRRAPRFSWTPAYEATFFRSLCDSVQLGLRENSSFKSEAWERAAQVLQQSHGAYPAKSHLINKSDNARKKFRLWRGLREDSEFAYDAVAKTVTASEEAWRAHIEREPLSRALRGRPFAHEEYMEILYPDVIGSGGAPKRIMKPRRRADGLLDDMDMPGTGILNLHLDSSPCQAVDGAEKQDAISTQTVAAMGPTSASMPGQVVLADESANQARKRALPQEPSDMGLEDSPLSPSMSSGHVLQPGGSPGKRARTSAQPDALSGMGSVSSAPAPSPSNTTPLSVPAGAVNGHRAGSEDTDNTAKGSSRLGWQEAALDLFFKEFADQDLDLQIKISETVLRDEHRALVFCKMPWRVRQHWVSRLVAEHHRAV